LKQSFTFVLASQAKRGLIFLAFDSSEPCPISSFPRRRQSHASLGLGGVARLQYPNLDEDKNMKFMITWSLGTTQFKGANARFLETGAGPPKGVTMLGRWHGTKSGSLVAETDDIKGLYEWTSQWSDLLDFTVTPVMDDAELAEVLKRIGS
jgi:Protein of unknown function (DUF3303)